MASSQPLTGSSCIHICVDVQAMFAEDTEWHAPWLHGVLPAIEALVDQQPARTLFTRFIPPASPEAAHGAWRQYYARWKNMTRERLPAELLDLVPTLRRHVPPASMIDKQVYSPWFNTGLAELLGRTGADTVIVTGGETEVCVLATIMGAIDHGFRVVVPTDAVFSSADATHDAMLAIYRSRFAMQLTTCLTQDLLDQWKDA